MKAPQKSVHTVHTVNKALFHAAFSVLIVAADVKG
jgi:isopentenyldiphosphate isomerase